MDNIYDKKSILNWLLGKLKNLLKYEKVAFSLFISLCFFASILMPIYQLVSENVKDLGIQYVDAILFSIFFSFLSFLFCLVFNSNFYRKVALLIAYSLIFSSFLNTFFVPNNLTVSDGTDAIELATRQESFYVLCAIFVVLMFPIFSGRCLFIKLNETLAFSAKLIIFASVLITFYQLSILPDKNSALLNSLLQGNENEQIILGKRNFLILSFDQIQGSAFEGFLESGAGSELKDKLDGFSLYPNAVSTYPNTDYSIASFMLARPVKDNKETISSVVSSNDSFFSAVAKKGIERKIYYTARKFNLKHGYFASRGNPILTYTYALNNAFGLNLTSLIYENSIAYQFSKYAWKADAWLLKLLPKQIVFDNEKAGTIVFMHFLFSHQPFMVEHNCSLYNKKELDKYQNIEGFIDTAKCISNNILRLINRLKNIGAYDNTAIFLLSDHGFEANIHSENNIRKHPDFFHEYSSFVSRDNIKPLGSYNPLVLYKNFNSHHPFTIKDEVASLIDIGSTVCDVTGCEFNKSRRGVPLNLLSNVQRQHDFWIYHGGRKTRSRNGHDKYHTFKMDYWKKIQARSLSELSKELFYTISCNEPIILSEGYIRPQGLSGVESWGRWSDGKHAEIEFKPKSDCKAQAIAFKLKAFVTPKNPEQTARVFINDQVVGNIRIVLGEAQPKTFIFPLLNVQDGTNSVRFEIDKPTTPKSVGVNKDTRKLGFGFINMELKDADFSLMLEKIVRGERKSWRILGANLPGNIDRTVTDQNSVVSVAGKKGYLTYGPYKKLPPNMYNFGIKYRYKLDEENVVTGKSYWDIVSDLGVNKIQKHFFDDSFNEFIWDEQTIANKRELEALELRSFFDGSGELEIAEVKIEEHPLAPICNERIEFRKPKDMQYYNSADLGKVEHWGRWSNGYYAHVNFQIKSKCNAKTIKLNLNAYLNSENPVQSANVYINNKFAAKVQFSLNNPAPKEVSLALPEAFKSTYLVRFEIDKPTTPQSIGVNKDTRKLGFGFVSMELSSNEAAQ